MQPGLRHETQPADEDVVVVGLLDDLAAGEGRGRDAGETNEGLGEAVRLVVGVAECAGHAAEAAPTHGASVAHDVVDRSRGVAGVLLEVGSGGGGLVGADSPALMLEPKWASAARARFLNFRTKRISRLVGAMTRLPSRSLLV